MCALQVADEIKKCKTPDDIRDRFNIRCPVAAPFAIFYMHRPKHLSTAYKIPCPKGCGYNPSRQGI